MSRVQFSREDTRCVTRKMSESFVALHVNIYAFGRSKSASMLSTRNIPNCNRQNHHYGSTPNVGIHVANEKDYHRIN